MRDRETGSWWQQVTGRAIAGELAGSALELMPNDELTFALWKSESPHALVLAPVAGHEKDYDKEWEKEVAKYPVPMTFPGQGLKDRDVILGVEIGGQARAFSLAKVRGESPVEDQIASNRKPSVAPSAIPGTTPTRASKNPFASTLKM